ncbi:MAG: murein L,D-transpeptidase [Hyphomicrobiales bacterium]|nr:MAG: murein L,D-transpeptidase [Hyphomicrobiales bacterium]|tara:strand:- start:2682 stop:3974 length:1293 start_codon:yes stop_codon:yes gene_type:complete
MKKALKQLKLIISPLFYSLLFCLYLDSTSLYANIYDEINKLERSDLFYAEDLVFESLPSGIILNEEQFVLPIISNESILTYQSYLEFTDVIDQYQKILKSGGWQEIKIDGELGIGDVSSEIIILRNRLMMTNDMPENRGINDIFDIFVEDGLKKFQFRHGITPTGVLDEMTKNALNLPIENKLRILGANKTRILNYMSGLGSKYIFVNIPGNYLLAVNDGKIEFQTKVVVGRDERPTPILSSNIYEINFFPYWHIPESIVRQDISKAMQIDSDYLEKNNIYIYQDYYYKDTVNPDYIDWYSDEPTLFKFRQNPGYANSLGVAKINFANKHAVFLHDTPNKSLYSDGQRFFSSGCVRVQNIDDLIQWLLSSNDSWERNKLENILNVAKTKTVQMKEQIPIKLGYLTAWVDDGQVHFREDIYGKDPVKNMNR